MNRSTCQCTTCGYEWPHGHDGSHSCTAHLLHLLDAAKAQKPLPNELTVAEHGTLNTAFIALEVQLQMSLDLPHYSEATRSSMEVDLADAKALREKLRHCYLVPIPRR